MSNCRERHFQLVSATSRCGVLLVEIRVSPGPTGPDAGDPPGIARCRERTRCAVPRTRPRGCRSARPGSCSGPTAPRRATPCRRVRRTPHYRVWSTISCPSTQPSTTPSARRGRAWRVQAIRPSSARHGPEEMRRAARPRRPARPSGSSPAGTPSTKVGTWSASRHTSAKCQARARGVSRSSRLYVAPAEVRLELREALEPVDAHVVTGVLDEDEDHAEPLRARGEPFGQRVGVLVGAGRDPRPVVGRPAQRTGAAAPDPHPRGTGMQQRPAVRVPPQGSEVVGQQAVSAVGQRTREAGLPGGRRPGEADRVAAEHDRRKVERHRPALLQQRGGDPAVEAGLYLPLVSPVGPRDVDPPPGGHREVGDARYPDDPRPGSGADGRGGCLPDELGVSASDEPEAVHYGFAHPAGTVTGICWVKSSRSVPVCVPDLVERVAPLVLGRLVRGARASPSPMTPQVAWPRCRACTAAQVGSPGEARWARPSPREAMRKERWRTVENATCNWCQRRPDVGFPPRELVSRARTPGVRLRNPRRPV